MGFHIHCPGPTEKEKKGLVLPQHTVPAIRIETKHTSTCEEPVLIIRTQLVEAAKFDNISPLWHLELA